MSRPEALGVCPSEYYNSKESQKYDNSSRADEIQTELSERAIELLQLHHNYPHYLLDVGCGSGISSRCIENAGHYWVGCDISLNMINLNVEHQQEAKHQPQGSLICSDMGQGLPFRPGMFDGAISISAIQWLCYSTSSEEDPKRRIARFFSMLYTSLKRGSKAIFQFYPENADQVYLLSKSASTVGFSGGVLVDYPNSSKAKKYYLCLSYENSYCIPRARDVVIHEYNSAEHQTGVKHRYVKRKVKKASHHVNKEWINRKKEKHRRQGKDVKLDSKYTGRKRPRAF